MRTVGSKLHVFDESDEYLAALQEFNMFDLGPSPNMYYLTNFMKFFLQEKASTEMATITKTTAIGDVKGESVWNNSHSTGGGGFEYYFAGATLEGCNVAVLLRWNAYRTSTGTIQINGQTVATKTVNYSNPSHTVLTYKGKHDGYINVAVSATSVDRYSSEDFSVGVSAIDRVS